MQLSGDMHHTEDATAEAVKEVRLTYKGVASLRQICVKKQKSTWKKNPPFYFCAIFCKVFFMAIYGYDSEETNYY